MNATADRLEFAPPPAPGLLRALGLAILAHAVLLAALTWGVHWKRNTDTVSAQAELWATLPQQAAPPPPVPASVFVPTPTTPAPPVALEPKAPDPDIALEREKQRVRIEKQATANKLEQEKREKLHRAQDKQRELEERQGADKRKAELEAKKKTELEAQRKESVKEQQEAARKLEEQRQANLRRMAGLAGSTGAPSATGTATQSAAPSAGYGSRVAAKVRSNIVYTESLPGNTEALVEVRTAPDGLIVSRKLLRSSGTRSWDDAVLKAIDKTEVLPRDVDGRVPSVLEISFRPRD